VKIYTRTGDDGTTGLFGGGRVSKHHLRIEAYGTVDETNSFIGLAIAYAANHPGAKKLVEVLTRIQEDLFTLGADLATPLDVRISVPRTTPEQVAQIEARIDEFDAEVPPLKHFILPGGQPVGAALHVARTVCRRAERLVVALAEQETVNPPSAIYLNRLSDFLFVLARWANHLDGSGESPWVP
jgi:cob(I)alamin adenosyltransferase